MQEFLIAFGLIVIMFTVPLTSIGAPDMWMIAGFWLAVAGLGFGLPTGAIYHVALYKALRSIDAVPDRWWVKPVALNARVPDERRFWVLAWCGLGALGFFIALIGCVLVGVGAVRSF